MRERVYNLQQTIQSLQIQGKYGEVIEPCYQLLQAATDAGDRQLQMEAYASFALCFYKLGDTKDAFHYIEQHAILCENHGTKEDYMYSYHIFHLLYAYTGNYGRARHVLETGIELAEQLENRRLVSENSSELSFVLCQLGEYAEALEAAKRGARIAALEDPYCPYLVLKATLASARACMGLGDFSAAEGLLETVMRDPLLPSYDAEVVQSWRLLADIQLEQGKTEESLASLEQAAERAQTFQDHQQLKQILQQQIRLCGKTGDFGRGFTIQQKYIGLLEDLQRQEISNEAMKLEMKVKLRELEKQANTDFLTGVASRRALEDTARKWLADPTETMQNIVCIAFDIDNLKKVNDTYGHPFGDQVIRKVAATCSSLLRKNDRTGRIGGDEFVAILRDITFQDACRTARRMLDAVTAIRLECNGEYVPLTLSIGVAESQNGRITDYSMLYHKADIALYKAKNGGKNQVVCYK
ncbi:hypothetical protein NCCP2716_17990 [Sporosarcina sp. NCCP-2716]|uniref:sensor domain-containing diguanylate cyclase n=1 Tax=Sporosarcina sp. NCCP-2716 TaxID=2943679 RepID=UPI0020408E01|nr:diguanylate cyclase [Sporosarcina sp. NCCP-2716]GKV69301.1 hypothetical protein NCCP2716_17990 [Sporosarcina sp. NCCP-2716]